MTDRALWNCSFNANLHTITPNNKIPDIIFEIKISR